MINELSQARLSPESDAYKRVYDLLEEHTVSWVTDAWKKNPTLDAIQQQPLYKVTLEQVLNAPNGRSLNPQKVRAHLALRDQFVVLAVNGV